MACVVAHLQSARYKRFQKKLRGPTRNEEPTRGIVGKSHDPVTLAQSANHVLFICLVFGIPFTAKEWLGHNTTPRQVTLAFNEKKVFQVFFESRSLTNHNLCDQDHLDVLISNDHLHRALLLKIPKEYDLVGSELLSYSVNKCSVGHYI